jgi:hypothetical protein
MQNIVCVSSRSGAEALILSVALLAGTACKGPVTQQDRAQMELDSIAMMEDKVFGDSLELAELTLAYDLATRMALFADSFPQHPKAGGMLFRSADLCQGLNQGSLSIKRFERFRRNFPKDSLVADALFMEGHVAETILADTALAKRKYNEFIGLYPDHPFAPGAKFSIENMGKTEEEMIQDLLRMGQMRAVENAKQQAAAGTK